MDSFRYIFFFSFFDCLLVSHQFGRSKCEGKIGGNSQCVLEISE